MDRQTIYAGRILRLELEDNKWEIVRHQAAVAVLALKDGKMLLVRQHRPAIGSHALELPAGLIEAGETPAQAAARELAEECNLGADLEHLISFYSSPGFTDELVHIFVAHNLHPAPGTPDADEHIEVVWLEPAQLLAQSKSGVASSGPTIAAAIHALHLRA